MLSTVLEYRVSGQDGLKDTEVAKQILEESTKALGLDGTDSDSNNFVSHVKAIASLCQFKSFCRQDSAQPRNELGV